MSYVPKTLRNVYAKLMKSSNSIPRNDGKPFPFVVTVTKDHFENQVDIVVRPEPIATAPELIPMVSERISKCISNFEGRKNDEESRLLLYKDITAVLENMWSSGLIKPKPEE